MEARIDGGKVTLFDYLATTMSIRKGKADVTQADRQTVLLFESEHLDLPAFSLYPEKYHSQFGHIPGRVDIDFEQNSAFPKGYVLQA
ncbi:MAG: hypothetical protein N2646_05445, partial [Bellilinea sp.]|nr:hypothetical protein [Bellilinea sp.]